MWSYLIWSSVLTPLFCNDSCVRVHAIHYKKCPAFALGMGGLIPEAIRKMESLRSKHDVELGVAMALLHFHGKAKMVDRYG